MRIENRSVFWFIVVYHVLIIALLPLAIPHLSWAAVGFFLVTFVTGGLSITAGYHRLFAHRAYAAHPLYEWAVLVASTLTFQTTALCWAHDHRLHHKYVDTDKDPYSIQRGFWHAHILWLFRYRRQIQDRAVPDLLKNPRIMFQHRHYLLLSIVVNLAVLGIGCLFLH